MVRRQQLRLPRRCLVRGVAMTRFGNLALAINVAFVGSWCCSLQSRFCFVNSRVVPCAVKVRPSVLATNSFARGTLTTETSRHAAGFISMASAIGLVSLVVLAGGTAGWRSTRGARDLGGNSSMLLASARGVDPMVSPFDGGSRGGRKPALPLTHENVEAVLDELRPFLRNDGGDCRIVSIDKCIVSLELQGACQSCSASVVTLKMGIERTLVERIPEIEEVISVTSDMLPLNQDGVEEVLNGIRPFFSVSGGTISFKEIVDGNPPSIVLEMSGPPLRSIAVRVEVVNRIRRKYPWVQDVRVEGAVIEATAST
eukprot:TRINITY_DN18793_c1_g1_i1.p1 TRINITY_DN18793_c1_g1~~TRINITY_DN18793_c1_g1_i1.p1  ORF type:complete len:313 (+),score=42.52 TRINITY_DN18793_c1_g1_i1:92-1030(+)